MDERNLLIECLPPPQERSGYLSPLKRFNAEREVGIRLPNDFHMFSLIYGEGMIGTSAYSDMFVLRTTSSDHFSHTTLDLIDIHNLDIEDGEEYFTYPLHPQKPGLIPIGSGSNRRTLFYYTDGDQESWPIVLLRPDETFFLFNKSFSQFVCSLKNGEVDELGGTFSGEWLSENSQEIRFRAFPPDHKLRPIHRAVSMGVVDGVTQKDVLTFRDERQQNLLFSAIQSGSVEAVRSILSMDADANHQDYESSTALHYAACFGIDYQAIELLIDAGANVNHQDENGFTPLMWAAYQNDPSKVQLLMDYGASHDMKAGEGHTALSLSEPKTEVQSILLSAGAE